VIVTESGTTAVPAATDLTVLVFPSGGFHWNQVVVARPPGLTLPLSVAVVDVTLDAANVVTTGAAVFVAAGAMAAAPVNASSGTTTPIAAILFHFIRFSVNPYRLVLPAAARQI
jgi:hypothetical protein